MFSSLAFLITLVASHSSFAAAPVVTQLQVKDATSGIILANLTSTSSTLAVDLSVYPSLCVSAITNPSTVGSVKFTYDSLTHIENDAPYSLIGDSASGCLPWAPTVKNGHTVSAVAYTSANATGTAGTALNTIFNITQSPPVAPVTSFSLVDSKTGTVLVSTIASKSTIPVTGFSTKCLNVRANMGTGTLGSVVFGLGTNATFWTENSAPYFLMDDSGSHGCIAAGTSTVTATGYSLASGLGIKGTSTTIVFTVSDTSATPTPTPKPSPTATPAPTATPISTGAIYYFSTSDGDDSRTSAQAQSSATPWKTIAKLNSFFSSLKAGDSMLLKRGDTFYGTITVSKSGTAALPITVGAYGTGNDPVVTGLTTVATWSNLGSNIWESTGAVSTLSSLKMVLVNGVQVAMGRYPNTGYLTYESFSGGASITSSALDNTNSTTTLANMNWAGAEAVITLNGWTMDRTLINAQVGSTLTYTNLDDSSPSGTAGYGFFIQNDPRTLDLQNEWYYNPSTKKIRIYSTSSPTNVQIASLNDVVVNNGFSYIIFDHLNLKGTNDDVVHFGSNNNFCHLQNLTVSFGGENGIYASGGTSTVMDHNTVTNCNRSGIEADVGITTLITHNTVSNMGLIPGQTENLAHAQGIWSSGNGNTVQYNTVSNTAYHGIYIWYNGPALVQYNYVTAPGLSMEDCGGIYLGAADTTGVRTIDHNVVMNIGYNGAPTNNHAYNCAGIYLDDLTSNVTVTNNTIANTLYTAIKMHRAHNNIVTGNTSFNNLYGIFYQDDTGVDIHDNTLSGNIFFAETSTQMGASFTTAANNLSTFFSSADLNYYARPITNDGALIVTKETSSHGSVNLVGWQGLSGKDAHSAGSPKAVSSTSNLRFEYNNTTSAKTISLDANYIDVKGALYSGSVTLAPFTSIVLIQN